MQQLANLAILLNLRLFALLKQVRLAANLAKPSRKRFQILTYIWHNGLFITKLQTIAARQDAKPQKKRRHSPHDLPSADSESEDNDHEASGKRRREEDELSISPSDDDINEFLEESNPREAEVTAKTTEPKEEVELPNL